MNDNLTQRLNTTMFEPTIGADPEVFIRDRQGNFISAHFFPGTKDTPYRTSFGAVQVDGVAAEFNIKPAKNLKQFLKGLNDGLRYVRSHAKLKNEDYDVAIEPVATFSKEYFQRLPPQVRELGCNPDFDAYVGVANPPPATDEPFRTGAGHIHIGWYQGDFLIGDPAMDNAHMADCIRLVHNLDASLYLCSHLWDTDQKRRTLYGRRGAFRPKPYGLEYRTLSNKWLSDPKLQAWVYLATRHTIELTDEDLHPIEHPELSKMVSQEEPLSVEQVLHAYNILTETYEYPELPKDYL